MSSDCAHPVMLLAEGEWWACDFPEREADPEWTAFVEGCRPCSVAFDVAVALNPGRGVDLRRCGDPFGMVPFIAPLNNAHPGGES